MSNEVGRERRSLLNLCLGVLGTHLEEITDHLSSISAFLPPSAKMTLLAIARRKDILTDDVLKALLDESWEFLDISGSKVTDVGLEEAFEKCGSLKAIDISRCNNLSPSSFETLARNCAALQTLRCGGTGFSDAAAKQSIHFIVPRLDSEAEAEESWETLESKQIGRGALALRWLVWPTIDEVSRKQLLECPKIVVNPAASAPHKVCNIPSEALLDVALDSSAIRGVDPSTWSVSVRDEGRRGVSPTVPNLRQPWSSSDAADKSLPQLSIAERFKLAFAERDERLASKRAKNSRQNQRRAEKAWLGSDTDAKAVFWAGIAQRSMKK